MRIKLLLSASLVAALSLVVVGAAGAKTLTFSGYQWTVRANGVGGPGPNNWSESNAWVDAAGQLHLKITKVKTRWYCGEVFLNQRLGFGEYKWKLASRVDRLDRNVVLGLFNYPTADVGPDATNEIDIEFARWGSAKAPAGNFTVWPAKAGLAPTTHTYAINLKNAYSTHKFLWSPSSIFFQSQQGLRDDNLDVIHAWTFDPAAHLDLISQQAMPVHMNLWLLKGRAPANAKAVEIIVKSFQFTPAQ